ncbi:MAG: Glu/Leu/Phe/Val dehydrogenase dimerization domain-containing protein [Bernardetiaceae bacterium]
MTTTTELTASQVQTTPVFEQVAALGHEQVVFCHDPHTGLRAIIGIHNTTLGPALGGTRMWNYATEAEALRDALRLSRGMTFKNAIAGLNLGGGKAVIIGNSRTDKSEMLLRRYGKFVDSLNGKYITAEDVGMGTDDIEYVAQETKFAAGIHESEGGAGDPSPFTALGTYMGMKAAAKKAYGSDSLTGKTVVVQGVGHVGQYLVDHLVKENCQVVICDIYEDQIKAVTTRHSGITVVAPHDIYDLPMDIYAPCALGATLNDATLEQLQCQIIAGAANNQLEDEDLHGRRCMEKGIIYAPDFLINAGGVINVYAEVAGKSREWVVRKTEKLYDMTLEVLHTAYQQNTPPQEVAIQKAMKRITAAAQLKAVR